MAERLNDNMGKKIVEALKMQNMQQEPQKEEVLDDDAVIIEEHDENQDDSESIAEESVALADQSVIEQKTDLEQPTFSSFSQVSVDNAFQQSINQNLNLNFSQNTLLQSDFEMPANVAVLNSLIAKLPAGVSKQTGAIIIKQTMEALGIPMSSVIQEAQQVQENLSNKARECQKMVLDYRKQINILELQAQQYQRQVISMNDIIGLFVNKSF
ncbi:hypothetical protein J6G99_01075 [bacterium]|nr:hypothetical protein [bacterium]